MVGRRRDVASQVPLDVAGRGVVLDGNLDLFAGRLLLDGPNAVDATDRFVVNLVPDGDCAEFEGRPIERFGERRFDKNFLRGGGRGRFVFEVNGVVLRCGLFVNPVRRRNHQERLVLRSDVDRLEVVADRPENFVRVFGLRFVRILVVARLVIRQIVVIVVARTGRVRALRRIRFR